MLELLSGFHQEELLSPHSLKINFQIKSCKSTVPCSLQNRDVDLFAWEGDLISPAEQRWGATKIEIKSRIFQ